MATDSIDNHKLADALSKHRNPLIRQLNVYTSIPSHSGFLSSGEHHGYILVDSTTKAKDIILHIPGGKVKEIKLDPMVICNSVYETLKGKNYLKLPKALGDNDIFLRECNDMRRSYNDVPCNPRLAREDIRLYLLTLLADLRKVPEGCRLNLGAKVDKEVSKAGVESGFELERKMVDAEDSARITGDLEARLAALKKGGKRKSRRKNKGSKRRRKTQKGGKKRRTTKRGGKRRKSRKNHSKKKH